MYKITKIISAIPILMLMLMIALNAYASNNVQGSEFGLNRGDPDRPSENSNYEGDLYCYEKGERDGESRTYNSDSSEDCQMNDGDNPYEDGFEYGCERDNTAQECNIIRLRDG